MKYFTFIAIVLLVWSCDDCCSELANGQQLIGKWQVVESGYSPGGGYVTNKIDEPNYVQFGSDHEFRSNYSGWDEIKYYKLTDASGTMLLELYPEEPKESNKDQLVYKYRTELDGDMLKVMYMFCTEGCHVGMVRSE